jgi:CheY-like chemotaxis protein
MNERRTILMVDDSEDNLFLMRHALQKAKCQNPLQEVNNGEEAIAYLKGEGGYIDRLKFPLPVVMLLDLNMPKTTGFDVLSWVRSQPKLKRLAIIIVTSSIRDADVDRAFDLGATGFLVKPIDLEIFDGMMQCLCNWVQINHFPPLSYR